MKRTVIGLDFGTLSARAILLDAGDGALLAEAVFPYPHGVMDKTLPDGTPVEPGAAYQDPKDYLQALSATIAEVLSKASVSRESVAGIGIDFTSCTMVSTDSEGTPLCCLPAFRGEPHAYVKLWKHHTAEAEAEELTDTAVRRGETFLSAFGGKVSGEEMLPKMLETARKAPAVYAAAHRMLDAADWLTWLLTGEEVRSSCTVGYKVMWNPRDGYPSKEYLGAVDPVLRDAAETKLFGTIRPVGTKAGGLSRKGSALTGLPEATAVAVPIIDAHASVPGMGITTAGKMALVLGTSGCQILLGTEEREVPGICGRVKDGVMPGFYAYEAGQSAFGDLFAWYKANCVPGDYEAAAAREGKDIFTYMNEKAARLPLSKDGLMALDWWGGNRTPYADLSLKGAFIGFTLQTKPEEMYRATLESAVFGTKAIVDQFEDYGVAVNEVCAAGGIARKNPYLMQMYADVLGRRIRVPRISQTGATGAAVFAAFAGGVYSGIDEAAAHLTAAETDVYEPDPALREVYAARYDRYLRLSELFAGEKRDLLVGE